VSTRRKYSEPVGLTKSDALGHATVASRVLFLSLSPADMRDSALRRERVSVASQLVLAAGCSAEPPILMTSSVIETAKTPALMVRTRTNSSVPRAYVHRRPVAAHPLRAGVAASGGPAIAIAIMVSLPRPVQAARGEGA
jgi:hypothetical protein